MSALLGEAYVSDAMPKEKSLEEHDKEKHPHGFNPKTDTCKFRDRIATETEEDKADIENPAEAPNVSTTGSDTTKKTLVTQEDIRGEFPAKKNDVQGGKEAYPQKQMGISHIFTGSAANYDKPSLLKVGTGEGSQVYGWGLYGSSKRGVGETYADISADENTKETIMKRGEPIKTEKNANAYEILSSECAHNGFGMRSINYDDVKSAVRTLESIVYGKELGNQSLPNWTRILDIENMTSEEAQWYIDELKNHWDEYSVDIKIPRQVLYEQTFFTDRASGDESHLMKWYSDERPRNLLKNISNNLSQEQLDAFNRAYKKAYHSGPGGRAQAVSNGDVYEILSDILGSPQSASEFLRDKCDIDGVKYPVDSYLGPIRDGDNVGWNYVSFRDDNIRIDKKYIDGQKMYDYEELMAKHHSTIDPMEVLSYLTKLDTPEEMAAEFARIMESGKIEKDGSSGERKSIRSKLIVSPEEDAAYLEAAENGDEKAVKRLFEKAAKRYLADSKVQSKVWHNTKKKFTEFRNTFPNVFFFAKDRKWADIFGKEERYSTKENTKPYYVRLEKPLDMRGERTGNEWLKFFEDNGIKLGEKGVEKLSKVGEETLPGWAILNHDISEPHGPGFRDSMVAAGFDGAAFEDTKRGTADRTTYGVFNSNAIKSADPVTYDDEGHVIPLSRRFNDGDDIRGDVSGKTEYIEKMKSLHPDINSNELIDRLKNLGSREEMEAEISKILGNK